MPCRNAAKAWVYPSGVPERAYQIEIIQTALLHNTLVCLPTGLGKTLIAAVVMHNFSRWFPQASSSSFPLLGDVSLGADKPTTGIWRLKPRQSLSAWTIYWAEDFVRIAAPRIADLLKSWCRARWSSLLPPGHWWHSKLRPARGQWASPRCGCCVSTQSDTDQEHWHPFETLHFA